MCEVAGYTPIFEWTSRQQRIVIDYPEDRLVLLHVRNIETGEYASRVQVNDLAQQYGIPVVDTLQTTIEDIDAFVAMTRGLKNLEGYVVQFIDGDREMLKLKADEYCLLHDTKETLNLEKNVIALVLDEALDDVLPQMDAGDRDAVTRFLDDVMVGANASSAMIKLQADEFLSKLDLDGIDDPRERKKQYAALVNAGDYRVPHDFYKPLLFRAFNPELDLLKEVLRIIKDNVGTATKVERVRPLLGGINWSDYRGQFEADS